LEEACLYDDRYRFLARGHRPDDRTWDRFVERIAPRLDELLREVLREARRHGLARGDEVALDGTKVAGSSSWWKHRKGSAESPSDPDARLMNSHGRKTVGYNVLTGVDTADGLIVGVEVVTDANDFHAAPVLMDAISTQLGELPAAAVADAGFETPASIRALEDRGVDTVFAADETLPEGPEEDDDGRLVCPVGKVLVRTGQTAKAKDGTRLYDTYRPEGGCRGCPLKANCPFFGKALEVPAGADPGARIRNRGRIRSAAYQGAMARRRSVETPYAFLQRHDRFERIRGRNLSRARAEIRLWVASYNLRKILRALAALFALLERRFSSFPNAWALQRLWTVALPSAGARHRSLQCR